METQDNLENDNFSPYDNSQSFSTGLYGAFARKDSVSRGLKRSGGKEELWFCGVIYQMRS